MIDVTGFSMGAGVKRLLLSVALAVIVPLANGASVHNSDVLDVDGFRFGVWAHDQSTLNLGSNADVLSVMLFDDASLNLNGGSIKGLVATGNSDVNVSSGNITSLMAFGDSNLTLNNVHGLDLLLMGFNSQLQLFANDVVFSSGYLSGSWADGSAFNIRAFNIGGMTVNAVTAVPVPAAIWLFSSAFLGLTLVGRSRKSLAHK